MREIKFRGKRVDNGEWVYGYYWAEEHRNQNAHHIYTKETKGETDLIRITGNFIVIQETVGQFTGLKDKKGVEIFEGDMVTSNRHKYEIVFSRGCFSFHNKSCVRVNQTSDDLWYVNEIGIIVIGNIHEVNK